MPALCRLVKALLLLSSIATIACEVIELPCSGNGELSNGTSGECECDPLYRGDQCQLCAHGFYGDPSNSDLCYLDCSMGMKLLSGYSLIGVGVVPQGFGQAALSRLSDFCLVVIAPGLDKPADSAETLAEFLNSSSLLPEFQLTLQFSGTSHSSCMAETVLIYRGLPEFLSSGNSLGSLSPSILLASFSGDQLLSASLTTEAAVVTVVYHRASQQAVGFNLTISASVTTAINETGAEETDGCAFRCFLSPNANSTACACSSPPPEPSYHTLLSSLQGTISENQNMTTDDLNADCSGRYHHSMVYDPCSQSLWLYGGRGLSSGCGLLDDVVAVSVISGGVRVVESEGVTPEGRYLHSAVLLRCSPESPSSRMLVFGGFTAVGEDGSPTPSGELWQFTQSQWTQLTSMPPGNALAGHAAVMAGGAMIVVGGVGAELQMSPDVLRYDSTNDSWEVLSTGELGPAGLYGHSAVYDAATDSMLVFGGYSYTRPLALPSATLYSLDLQSLEWTLLQTTSQPPARVFHSAVLVGGYLVLHGGLVEVGGGTCASSDVTLIAMDNTTCQGRAVVTLPGEEIIGDPPRLWGHAAALVDSHIVVSGGFSATARDAISLLSLPDSLECSLAQTAEECLNIPNCAYCEMSANSAVRCYDTTSLEAPTCNSTLGPRNQSCDTRSQCSNFATCRQCLSVDTARLLGCVWCGCPRLPGVCIAAGMDDCSCDVANSSNPGACYLDSCESPSCARCMESEECRWIGNTIVMNPNAYFSIIVSDDPEEWGCYSSLIQNAIINHLPDSNTLLPQCPPSCSEATSCTSCVQSTNPNAGNLTCVWASYTQQCISPDAVPLLCSEGTCGYVVTNSIVGECSVPDPCSKSTSCVSCLQNPRCGWYQPRGETLGVCSNVSTPLLQQDRGYYYLECPPVDECEIGVDSCRSDQGCRDLRHGHTCFCMDGYRESGSQCVPICTNDCNGQGQCIAPSNCSCDLGFVGEDCGTACHCNGHSDCLESSLSICLECLHNTQGPSCEECLPFHVGSPQEGSGCVPCLEYCHGNSDLCLRVEELQEALGSNITLERNQLIASDIVRDGPSETEGVCPICGGQSFGNFCESCREGYFHISTSGSNIVNCTRCRCNGHGDTCDPVSGSGCTCQNNTMTPLTCTSGCHDVQCSECVQAEGYAYLGNPVDNSQCYRAEQMINAISTYNRSANQTAFVAVPPTSFLYSDVNVRVTIELEMGVMDVYVTGRIVADTDDPIKVTVGENGQHVVSVRNGFDVVSMGAVDVLKISDSTARVVYHAIAENRLVVVIPFRNPQFQFKTEYFTFLAKKDAKFHFYYRQDPPRLNLVVFFSVFLSSFCMVSCVTLLVWKLLRLYHRTRRAQHRRQRRQERASRPFDSVRIYFDTSLFRPSRVQVPSKPDSHRKRTEAKKRMRVQESMATNVPTLELAPHTSQRERMDLNECRTCPIAIQPTSDRRAAVSTVLIQLPSHGRVYYGVCTGSTLADCSSKDGGSVKKNARLTKRTKCTSANPELRTTPM